jgi:hypothetical protein
MKTARWIGPVAMLALIAFLFSCESNPEVESQEDLLPENFKVEIPGSISNTYAGGRISTSGRMADDTLLGNEVYKHLGTFIAVGKAASEIAEEFIHGIRKHHINRVMTMTFAGEDDGRAKNLTVTETAEFEGRTWDYYLNVTDADSEGNSDGGKALQIFWNRDSQVTGVAIIKPFNCDRDNNADSPDAMFRIDYSEDGSLGYDAHMEVLISGLPTDGPGTDQFAMSTLHMFAGRKGDVVDVYGNSNHPNAKLFSDTGGFNWAFVASANKSQDFGVAEVGLPPSTLDSNDPEVILKDYSVMNVFRNEITEAWPEINQDLLTAYLSNTAAPGYFNNGGFMSGGVSPGAQWDELTARIASLSPYSPAETSSLTVAFR